MKSAPFLVVLSPLIVFAQPAAHSLLGLNVAALEQRWGKGKLDEKPAAPAERTATFTVDGVSVSASFIGGRCEMLVFSKNDGVLSPASIKQILERTGGGWIAGPDSWTRPDGSVAVKFLGGLAVSSGTWAKAQAALEKARDAQVIKGL